MHMQIAWPKIKLLTIIEHMEPVHYALCCAAVFVVAAVAMIVVCCMALPLWS